MTMPTRRRRRRLGTPPPSPSPSPSPPRRARSEARPKNARPRRTQGQGLHSRTRVRLSEVTPACRPPLTHARTVESPVRPVWTGRVFMCSRDVVTLLRLARVCVRVVSMRVCSCDDVLGETIGVFADQPGELTLKSALRPGPYEKYRRALQLYHLLPSSHIGPRELSAPLVQKVGHIALQAQKSLRACSRASGSPRI